jgi:hypothetical protein
MKRSRVNTKLVAVALAIITLATVYLVGSFFHGRFDVGIREIVKPMPSDEVEGEVTGLGANGLVVVAIKRGLQGEVGCVFLEGQRVGIPSGMAVEGEQSSPEQFGCVARNGSLVGWRVNESVRRWNPFQWAEPSRSTGLPLMPEQDSRVVGLRCDDLGEFVVLVREQELAWCDWSGSAARLGSLNLTENSRDGSGVAFVADRIVNGSLVIGRFTDSVERVDPRNFQVVPICRLPEKQASLAQCAVSSDGQTVLVGTRRGNIIVVDPSVQEPLGEFHVVGSPIRCLSISPDGQLAAFTQISQPTPDTVVHLWSITERKLVGKVRVPGSVDRRDLAEQELVRVISWEKSANTIIVGFHTGRIVAIDLAAGHKRSTNRE